MIKRIIGILATLAVIVIVVFTALNCGSYKSMLPEDLFGSSGVVNSVLEANPNTVPQDVEAQAEK